MKGYERVVPDDCILLADATQIMFILSPQKFETGDDCLHRYAQDSGEDTLQ